MDFLPGVLRTIAPALGQLQPPRADHLSFLVLLSYGRAEMLRHRAAAVAAAAALCALRLQHRDAPAAAAALLPEALRPHALACAADLWGIQEGLRGECRPRGQAA